MNRKFTLAIVALLGFATACSSVKNAPAKGRDKAQADSTLLRRIVVMYGVRTPMDLPKGEKTIQRASETPPRQDSPASHVDPVLEQPSDGDIPKNSLGATVPASSAPAKK